MEGQRRWGDRKPRNDYNKELSGSKGGSIDGELKYTSD